MSKLTVLGLAFFATISPRASAVTETHSEFVDEYHYDSQDIASNQTMHHLFGDFHSNNHAWWFANGAGFSMFGPYKNFNTKGHITAQVHFIIIGVAGGQPDNGEPNVHVDLTAAGGREILDHFDIYSSVSGPFHNGPKETTAEGFSNYTVTLRADVASSKEAIEVRVSQNKAAVIIDSVVLTFFYDPM